MDFHGTTNPIRTRLLVRIGLVLLGGPALGAQGTVDFQRDVRPLLSDRCFSCHGPDEAHREAGLRLDRAEGKDGAYRVRAGTAAVAPGSPEDSELWYRVSAGAGADSMPPLESHKPALDSEEREVLRRWIEAGAPYEGHWAFEPPEAQPLPQVEGSSWSSQALDRFVLQRLQSEGLAPSPRATQRGLIRRLSLDLTGLPPTPAEIQAYLDDASPGAYEAVVDRLLASPRYGEHMTKSWLDLVRFADTNGVHHDHYREMTHYRDWVIRSFNGNLPYDRFVTAQVAGDLAADPSTDELIASGFNRLHLIIDRGTALPEESYTRNAIDRVTAVGTAFLGLTVQCAVCHDHKYDPLTQKDFYGLFAFFNNLDGAPETGGRGTRDFQRGLQPPYISFPSDQQSQALEEIGGRLASLNERVAELQSEVEEASEEAPKAAAEEALKRAEEEAKKVRSEETEVLLAVPAAMVMRERKEVKPAYLLKRGAYDQLGEEVERSTPAFLPPMAPAEGLRTRRDLAEWLVAPEHPLTARVAVNRVWQQFFGVGLVKTSEDFGTQGEYPSHPELLDYLSLGFVASGWDLKALIKQIVLSETYRQSSVADGAAYREDPDNRRLARGSRFRLDSEVIRDQILATSGLLVDQLYGKSVKPPQPAGIWAAVSLPDSFPRTFQADEGDAVHRRSLYTFWKRGMPPPQMTLLDAPTREACIARRERTNTPLQALLLLNESEYLAAARHLAAERLQVALESDAIRLVGIYETITSRVPDGPELASLEALLADLQRMYGASPERAKQLCEGLAMEAEVDEVRLAAWTVLTSTIYNLDITKTRD